MTRDKDNGQPSRRQRPDRADMARRGRIGAYRLWARTDPVEHTRPAREAALTRFLRDIPEDLPAAERERRARYARRAYFAALSRKAVLKRKSTSGKPDAKQVEE